MLNPWRSTNLSAAHELLAGGAGRCFHSPGPRDVFREDELDQVLRDVLILEVLSRATTTEARRPLSQFGRNS